MKSIVLREECCWCVQLNKLMNYKYKHRERTGREGWPQTERYVGWVKEELGRG